MGEKIKLGLFGIGLNTYWAQYDGLFDKLKGYQQRIKFKLEATGHQVIDAGIIDSPHKAIEAADLFRGANIDLILLNISTYALSHNVLPLVQRIDCPVIIMTLQPLEAIEYEEFNSIGDRGKMTGEWLAYCQSCVTPELVNVFQRAGIKFQLVTGFLEQKSVWEEIYQWIEVCLVRKILKNNRVGVLGHYYNGMLDVYSDTTLLSAAFGSHFELIEFGTLKRLREIILPSEAILKISEFREWFSVSPDCTQSDLEQAAITSIALDRFVAINRLTSLAYYYEGDGDPMYEKIVTTLIPGMTLLTGRNIPAAGECEIKNVLAMKILDSFNVGGSFSEFYALDFNDEIILLGHDGPAHYKIADGKVGLVPLPAFHGKPGKGLSIQMKVLNGPVTLLSVCQHGDGSLTLLTAQGESVEGPTLQIGNTNSRYRFPIGIREFINNWSGGGPAHHCAIGIGHISEKIKKLAWLLNIKFKSIC